MESTFISQYRQTIQQIEVSATKPWVIDELRELGEKLTTSLERDFEKHPGSTTPYNLLKKALRECLKMEESAFVKTRAYRDGLPLTLDLTEYQGKCSTVKAIYEANGDVVGNLLVLLLDHWQEAEAPEKYQFLIDWNKSKSIIELVREFGGIEMRKRLNAVKAPATQIATAASGTEIKPKPNGRELKTAKLLPGIKQDSVNDLLRDGGVGEKYTKPGEWAAAFRALYVAGALKGTAPEVTRWAVKQGYIEESALETVKKAWSGEWNEAEQFPNADQSTVFRTIHLAAINLLNLSKLHNNNN